MNIEKIYEYDNKNGIRRYMITFKIKDNDRYISAFKRSISLTEDDAGFIDINKLNDLEFLKKYKIEYLLEKDINADIENIIPIGLIGFNNYNIYPSEELKIWNYDSKDLYKANDIINNIEKAIKIKYEELRFTNNCDNKVITEIPLD